MKEIQTKNAPQAIGPYSQAIEANNIIFTSGQIPLLPDGQMVQGDIKKQTQQVLKNLEAILIEAGSGLENVIKTTIYLSSMDDFNAVNEVYASFFKEHKPARSTIAVKTLPKNVSIEIDAICLKK